MTALFHHLFPTVGDAAAVAAWVLLAVFYVAARWREAVDVLDRILDDVFGSGR
jgi:hypothetical protein